MDMVAENPMAGDLVRGSGGVRKVRFAHHRKGKSGGLRVMSAYVGENAPVYLLAILSKRDREDFSDAEMSAMKVLVTKIKNAGKRDDR